MFSYKIGLELLRKITATGTINFTHTQTLAQFHTEQQWSTVMFAPVRVFLHLLCPFPPSTFLKCIHQIPHHGNKPTQTAPGSLVWDTVMGFPNRKMQYTDTSILIILIYEGDKVCIHLNSYIPILFVLLLLVSPSPFIYFFIGKDISLGMLKKSTFVFHWRKFDQFRMTWVWVNNGSEQKSHFTFNHSVCAVLCLSQLGHYSPAELELWIQTTELC